MPNTLMEADFLEWSNLKQNDIEARQVEKYGTTVLVFFILAFIGELGSQVKRQCVLG